MSIIAVRTDIRGARSFHPGERVEEQVFAPGESASTQAVAAEVAALQVLLRIEREARTAASVSELHYLAANETRRLVQGRQFFLLAWDRDRFKVAAISSVSAVDRESPFVQWLEAALKDRFPTPPTGPSSYDVAVGSAAASDHAEAYPFPHMLMLPMSTRTGVPLGALLVAREQAWDEEGLRVGERLAETYAHAWSAFRRPPLWTRRMRKPSFVAGAVLLAIVALGLTPTRLTALAGFEVVPDRPFVVAASSDGTIESVEVRPNTEVVAGQVLYKTVSTQLRDNLLIADRAVGVAEAKWKQYEQAAFVDPQAKRELAAAAAEFELKRAERDYAADLLEKTVTRAPRAGIAIFNDANDLAGRPVVTGQRIMEIADRSKVIARIDVPVDDSVVLADGARARLFLDSDPLHAVEATISHASHGARMLENNLFAFRADARLADDAALPRLGVRGTAEIYGPQTTMLFYLFRRPLSYLRQHYGL